MKTIILLALTSLGQLVFAQTKIDQIIQTNGVEEIKMVFKYPDLINITTWDKDEISIKGTVSINNGKNDMAFKIDHSIKNNQLLISSQIDDYDNLPKGIMIKKDGNEYYFDTDDTRDSKVQAFLKEAGHNYQYQVHGVIKDIKLEIQVPRDMALNIEAKYGLVEVINVSAPLYVNSKYGGVDVSLSTTVSNELTARTKYGQLFSDMDLSLDRSSSQHGDFNKWTTVVAKLNGGGAICNLESKYGNVYIRKQ